MRAAAIVCAAAIVAGSCRRPESADAGTTAVAPAPAASAIPALLAATLAATPLVDDLRELTDVIGGRPTGSPALEKAVAWALGRFRTAGVDVARTEEYRAPLIWLPREESAEVIAPVAKWQPASARRLRVAAMPLAAPARGVEGEVADVGKGDEEGFRGGGALAGKWLLVRTEPMKSLEDLFKEYLATPGIFARAQAAKAAGVLWMSNRPGKLLYRHNATLNGTVSPMAGVLVEREGALRVARAVAQGPVRLRVRSAGEVRENARAHNVVAEVRGREKPDEVVILGAHLDSWDLGRGALDNGCNAALVVDVARQAAALAKAGTRPRRTLRFVLYTGEEVGLYGSWQEVQQHRAELDRVRAQIVFDIGSGRTTGFSLGGRADLRAAVEEALAPVAALGPLAHTADAYVGTDNYDYLLEGVPTLVANQEGAPYLPDYHAESDTFDKVDLREVKLNAAIAAVLAWGLAERPAPPAPRQRRMEVEELLRKTGLEGQMKIFGLWEAFAAGKRGRARE